MTLPEYIQQAQKDMAQKIDITLLNPKANLGLAIMEQLKQTIDIAYSLGYADAKFDFTKTPTVA